MRISALGVSGSMDDDEAFLSAMADECQEAECQSPIPGPLDPATTWVLLTELGRKLEQMLLRLQRHHLLLVVQEWSVSLLAWLCVGVYDWCGRQVEPSTHALLATQVPGRGGAGPLLRSRLAQKSNIVGNPEGMENRWSELGART